MSFLLKVLPIALALILAGAGEPVFADSEMGRQVFKKRLCSLCHVVNRPGTEFRPMCPGLKGVKQLHSKAWVRKWLKNPSAVWKTNDEGVQSINARYFKYRGGKPKPRESFMATIVGKRYVLADKEIEDLIDYLWSL